MTFVAGLYLDGLVAPWCLDAPMNGAAFLAYVETQLCPVLKQGDTRVTSSAMPRIRSGLGPRASGHGAEALESQQQQGFARCY